MWWWALWLYNIFGLSGALTVWSLFELFCAAGFLLLTFMQGVGIFLMIMFPPPPKTPERHAQFRGPRSGGELFKRELKGR